MDQLVDIARQTRPVCLGHLAVVLLAYAIAGKYTRTYALEMGESGKIVMLVRFEQTLTLRARALT